MYRVDASFLLRVRRVDGHWRLTLQELRTGEWLEFTSWEAIGRYLRSLPPPRTRQ